MDYNIIIHKYLTNDISVEERRLLMEWLKDSAHQRVFDEICQIWNGAFQEHEVPEGDLELELSKLENAIDESRQIKSSLSHYKITSRLMSILAVVLLIGLIGIVITPGHFFPANYNGAISIISRQENEVLLADRSRILVNQNSSVSFRTLDRERGVDLSGEAFFEVSKSPIPFVVYVGDFTVTALGTSFIVKAYPDESIVVTVISGNVRLQYSELALTIDPQESGTIRNGKLYKTVNSDQNFNSWYTHRLVFNRTPLKAVLEKLHREYHIQFVATDTDLFNCRFTGVFDHSSIEDILHTLSFSLNINFDHQTKNIYKVTGKGCVP